MKKSEIINPKMEHLNKVDDGTKLEIPSTIKKSDILFNEARKEENDFKAIALTAKAIRERRMELFESKWLEIVSKQFKVELRPNGSYSINTQLWGILDYYPKSDKLLIRKENKWKKQGLNFLKVISTMQL